MIVRCIIVLLLFAGLLASGAPAGAADARLAEAQTLLHEGNREAAEALWRAVAVDAAVQRDAETLDSARQGLGSLAFQSGDYDRFTALQHERLADAEARADARIHADARMELALLARRRGQLAESRDALDGVIRSFRALGDPGAEGRALTHQGLVLLNLGQFAQALDVLEQALALHNRGAQVEVDRTYHYLGLLYRSLREPRQAQHYLRLGLRVARADPDPMRAAPLLGSLARVANDTGEFSDALLSTEESLTLARRAGSVPGEAYSLLERGRALLGLERLDEANLALEHAHRLSLTVSQERTAADATFVLGRVALAAGDADAALRHFREAVINYEAAKDAPQTIDAYRLMIPLLRERGDYAEVARLAEAGLELELQVAGRDVARRIALIEYRKEVADTAHQIELLERENEIQQLRLASQRLDRHIGLSVIAGLALAAALAAALLALAVWRSRRTRRALFAANRELEANRVALGQANAALAERAQVLAQAAATDSLTGLANRAHVLDGLEESASRAHSGQHDLAVLMLDVDRFKGINDGYGHRTGDRVLRAVAALVRTLLPPDALAGRYGGEEFLLVLPRHDLESARRVAERVRCTVENAREPGIPQVTVSIGVAVRRSGSDIDPDQMLEEADQALYRAKQSGRNRVEVALRVA